MGFWDWAKGIAKDTYDYWSKPNVGERLRDTFVGADRLVNPGERIEEQVNAQTGGDEFSTSPEQREPRGRNAP